MQIEASKLGCAHRHFSWRGLLRVQARKIFGVIIDQCGTARQFREVTAHSVAMSNKQAE